MKPFNRDRAPREGRVIGALHRGVLVVGLLALVGVVTISAQEAPAPLECGDEWRGWQRGRPGFCEIRELRLPAAGTIVVDGDRSGGIRVIGEARDDVLARARVIAWAGDEDEARDTASRVEILTDGAIRAEGPRHGRRVSWSVSFELRVPANVDLELEASNGGIAIDGVHGRIQAETVNGGIRLDDVGGKVRASTTNGGVAVRLTGDTWRGEGLDVQTTNGGVVIRVPEGYSASVDAAAVNGGVRVGPARGGRRSGRSVTATLGDGGPLLRARTVNGGVSVRSD